jgi:hypothetical protein
MSSSKKYVRPTEAMTTSAKIAHFLEFCHKNRAGERVPWREIVMTAEGLPRLPMKDNPRVIAARRGADHVRNIMLREYGLGIDNNADGVRVLENFEDVMESSVVPVVRELDQKRRKVEKRMGLAQQKVGEIENSDRGRAAKALYDRVSSATKGVQRFLPTDLIRGYMTSGDDD